MNIVDIVILAIIGLSILVGLYRGFISSVASLGGSLLSLALSFWLSPKMAAAIQNNPEILKTLASIPMRRPNWETRPSRTAA